MRGSTTLQIRLVAVCDYCHVKVLCINQAQADTWLARHNCPEDVKCDYARPAAPILP